MDEYNNHDYYWCINGFLLHLPVIPYIKIVTLDISFIKIYGFVHASF